MSDQKRGNPEDAFEPWRLLAREAAAEMASEDPLVRRKGEAKRVLVEEMFIELQCMTAELTCPGMGQQEIDALRQALRQQCAAAGEAS
jgi:hypothetical protein